MSKQLQLRDLEPGDKFKFIGKIANKVYGKSVLVGVGDWDDISYGQDTRLSTFVDEYYRFEMSLDDAEVELLDD